MEELIVVEKDIVVFDGVGSFNHLQDIIGFFVGFHEVGVCHQDLEFIKVNFIETFV